MNNDLSLEKLKKKAIQEAQSERDLAKHMGFGAVVNLILGYGIAFGIWGLALKMSFLLFVFAGVIVALLVIGFLSSPLFFMQRTSQHIEDIKFVVGLWLKTSVIIGVLGSIVWIIRSIFFH